MVSYASESPVSVWLLNGYTVRFDSIVGRRNCSLKTDFTPTFCSFNICYAQSLLLERPPGVPHRTYWLQGELVITMAPCARSRCDRICARASDSTESFCTGGSLERRQVNVRRYS